MNIAKLEVAGPSIMAVAMIIALLAGFASSPRAVLPVAVTTWVLWSMSPRALLVMALLTAAFVGGLLAHAVL